MTDEEKKEFEEFLEWKKLKKEQEEKKKKSEESSADEHSVAPTQKQEISADKEGTSSNILDDPKVSSSDKKKISIAMAAVVIALIVLVIGTYNSGNRGPSNNYLAADSDTLAEESVDTLAGADSDTPGEGIETGWERTVKTDPMNDSKSIFVTINSDNSNNVGGPYGEVTVQLMVRKMKKYGTDVIIQSSDGQIYGSEYNNDNYVTIRFDSGSPMRFYFDEAADGSSDYIFLRKRSTFIEKAKKAKKITVEIPYYQAGRQIFYFTTDKPLEW